MIRFVVANRTLKGVFVLDILGFSPNQVLDLRVISCRLNSGQSTKDCLAEMSTTALDDNTRNAMSRVSEKFNAEPTLSKALKAEDRPWDSPLFAHLVSKGETDGVLEEAFAELTRYFDWRAGASESMNEEAIWFRTLGLALTSWLPILEALSIAGEEVSSPQLKEATQAISEKFRNGDMRRLDIVGYAFEPWTQSLFQCGEDTGTLDEICYQIADIQLTRPA